MALAFGGLLWLFGLVLLLRGYTADIQVYGSESANFSLMQHRMVNVIAGIGLIISGSIFVAAGDLTDHLKAIKKLLTK